MGLSFSSNRRRQNAYYHHHPPPPPPPPPPPYYYSTEPRSLPPPHPTPPPPPPPQQNYYATTTNTTHQPSYPYPVHSYYNPGPYNSSNYGNHMVGRFNYHPFYSNGWAPVGPGLGPSSQVIQPAPYVEHQNAKKIRNDVNVHKSSLKLEIDEQNPDHHLVSFVFDAMFDGSITIFYFAKEEPDCKFVPAFPEAHVPVRIPFQKGFAQKFRQPSGTGIDLGFFALDDLSKPSEEDTFPLVIVAESCSSDHLKDEHVDDSVSNTSSHMQITQAVIDKKDGEPFKVRAIKQILRVDGVSYELRDIYGIGSSAAENFDDGDTGKECVICMTEPKDTAVLPCRHMCMCSDCAKALRLQSNKCPICRQPIEELIEIKINGGDH